jgi:hypothetical protein
MSTTYAAAFARHNIDIPPHLDAQTIIPVLSDPQRQGDILALPETGPSEGDDVGAAGVQLVAGEHTGNTHWLDNDDPGRPVKFVRGPAGTTRLGTLCVPDGTAALITHTDEHGSMRAGPGRYELRRQREASRVVAD